MFVYNFNKNITLRLCDFARDRIFSKISIIYSDASFLNILKFFYNFFYFLCDLGASVFIN